MDAKSSCFSFFPLKKWRALKGVATGRIGLEGARLQLGRGTAMFLYWDAFVSIIATRKLITSKE